MRQLPQRLAEGRQAPFVTSVRKVPGPRRIQLQRRQCGPPSSAPHDPTCQERRRRRPPLAQRHRRPPARDAGARQRCVELNVGFSV